MRLNEIVVSHRALYFVLATAAAATTAAAVVRYNKHLYISTRRYISVRRSDQRNTGLRIESAFHEILPSLSIDSLCHIGKIIQNNKKHGDNSV